VRIRAGVVNFYCLLILAAAERSCQKDVLTQDTAPTEARLKNKTLLEIEGISRNSRRCLTRDTSQNPKHYDKRKRKNTAKANVAGMRRLLGWESAWLGGVRIFRLQFAVGCAKVNRLFATVYRDIRACPGDPEELCKSATETSELARLQPDLTRSGARKRSDPMGWVGLKLLES